MLFLSVKVIVRCASVIRSSLIARLFVCNFRLRGFAIAYAPQTLSFFCIVAKEKLIGFVKHAIPAAFGDHSATGGSYNAIKARGFYREFASTTTRIKIYLHHALWRQAAAAERNRRQPLHYFRLEKKVITCFLSLKKQSNERDEADIGFVSKLDLRDILWYAQALRLRYSVLS